MKFSLKILLLSSFIILAFLYYVTSGNSISQSNAVSSQKFAKQFFKAMLKGSQKDVNNLVIKDLRDSQDADIEKFRANANLKSLGELRQLGCNAYSSKKSFNFFGESSITANCHLDAEFENGSVWMKTEMLDDHSLWYITRFEYGSNSKLKTH